MIFLLITIVMAMFVMMMMVILVWPWCPRMHFFPLNLARVSLDGGGWLSTWHQLWLLLVLIYGSLRIYFTFNFGWIKTNLHARCSVFSSVLRGNCGTTLVIMVQTTGNDLSKAQAHEKVFMHIREKPNKSSQCNFSNSQTGNLMRHIKSHISKKTNKCSVTSSLLLQVTWRHIWKHIAEKNQM